VIVGCADQNNGLQETLRRRPCRVAGDRRHPHGRYYGYFGGRHRDVRPRSGGSGTEHTPQASFGFETTDTDGDSNAETVTATHETGDTIDASSIQLKIGVDSFQWGTDEVSAGDSFTIADEPYTGSNPTDDATLTTTDETIPGKTLRVVYDNPDSDSSSTIGKFEIPSA